MAPRPEHEGSRGGIVEITGSNQCDRVVNEQKTQSLTPRIQHSTRIQAQKCRFAPNACHSPAKEAVIKFLELVNIVKHLSLRFYIVFWHELSMDPRVRLSPWSPPPENEVKLNLTWTCWYRGIRIFMILTHYFALKGLVCVLTGQAAGYTLLWALFLGIFSGIAACAGSHRLWSHRSYKANLPVRLILGVFQTIAMQYSIRNWARDHRIHHKYVDTDADPHNASRGFFFSHMGWLMIGGHSEFLAKKKVVNTSDIEKDPVVYYQQKYYLPLVMLLNYYMPTVVPMYFWGEDWKTAFLVASILRQVLVLHGTFMINSAAHMWGNRPYDKNIAPTENMLVAFTSFGDGWHNYHHVFPWDYRNSEFWDYKLNLSTLFIDLFSLIGWTHDLKTVKTEVVKKRCQRTGDGSHQSHHSHHHEDGEAIWGWNDPDMTDQEKFLAEISNKSM